MEPASFTIATVDDAARTLDYFNGFHDGFMKRIVIDSRDSIAEDLSQSSTGLFDVTIDFAHYNYARGEEPFHPHDQIVRGEFRRVQGIFADFHEGYLGNSISSVSVTAANRKRAGETASEPCLALYLARNFLLEEHRSWELRKAQVFTFAEARLFEL